MTSHKVSVYNKILAHVREFLIDEVGAVRLEDFSSQSRQPRVFRYAIVVFDRR